jgi:hypothetical protein
MALGWHDWSAPLEPDDDAHLRPPAAQGHALHHGADFDLRNGPSVLLTTAHYELHQHRAWVRNVDEHRAPRTSAVLLLFITVPILEADKEMYSCSGARENANEYEEFANCSRGRSRFVTAQ